MKSYFTHLFFIALFFAVISCSYTNKAPISKNEQQKDSITTWLEQAADTVSPVKEMLLDKAYGAVLELPEDTIRSKHLLEISKYYYRANDTAKFRKINKQALQFALKLGDSLRLADLYWGLGFYFSYKDYKIDSAYYYFSKAQELYEKTDNDFSSAIMLMNMGVRQIHIKDYTGAEINTIKAVKLLKPLKRYRQLYGCYNNLGIIHNNLRNYDKALEYYDQALEYLENTDQKNALEHKTLNNMGSVYQSQEKYKKALKKYEESKRKNDLYVKNPILKARAMDNIAYAKFKMGDTTGLPELFYDALKISDSLNDIKNIVMNKLHMADYYAGQKDTVNALKYAHETRELAKPSLIFRDLLSSLQILSKMESCENGVVYLEEYIKINDSLQLAERNLRGKYTRIRFETDQLVVEKAQLTKDKALFRLFIISLSVIVVFISGFAYYYYRRQRLYRIRFKALLNEKDVEKQQPSTKTRIDVVADLNISETALRHITERLKVFIEKKKYLNNNVSLNNWAKAMESNPKYLSQVINFYKQKSFTDYIKDLRIDHTIEQLKTNAIFRKYSIKAIAEEVGFNTAESFSKAFYKKTGIYPSYFIKELDKELYRKQSA